MTLFGKTIIAIIVLAILGIGAYTYATRPVAAPSENLASEQATTTAVDTDGGAAASSDGLSSASSTATSTSQASVATYKIASGTKAEFNIQEELRGSPFLVVGTTADVAGSVQVDAAKPEDSVIGTIKINARTFKTDSSNRDGAIGRFILKSEDAKNEFVTFSAKSISDVPADAAAKIAAGEQVSFKITGDLTITGITKTAVFDAKFAMAKDGKITGTAEAKIKRSDFKLVIPNIPFVANVPDEFLIKINAVLVK